MSIGKLFEKTVRMYVSSIFRSFMNDEVSKVFFKNLKFYLKCFHLTYITINLNIIAETAVWQHAGKIQQSSRQVTLKKKWYRGIAIAN